MKKLTYRRAIISFGLLLYIGAALGLFQAYRHPEWKPVSATTISSTLHGTGRNGPTYEHIVKYMVGKQYYYTHTYDKEKATGQSYNFRYNPNDPSKTTDTAQANIAGSVMLLLLGSLCSIGGYYARPKK